MLFISCRFALPGILRVWEDIKIFLLDPIFKIFINISKYMCLIIFI